MTGRQYISDIYNWRYTRAGPVPGSFINYYEGMVHPSHYYFQVNGLVKTGWAWDLVWRGKAMGSGVGYRDASSAEKCAVEFAKSNLREGS